MPSSSKRSSETDVEGYPEHKPTKKVRKAGPIKWTVAEEARFLEIIDTTLEKHLWSSVKQDETLAHRGSDGVTRHWQAMYKKLMAKQS